MKKILKIEENKIDDMEIKNEIDIFQKLDHPNIVILLSLNFINMENHFVYLYWKKIFRKTKFHFIKFFLVIIHQDIKSENIMISDIEKDLERNSW